MTDLERVTKLAEECGIITRHYTPEFINKLLAFEQAVLAKRDEEIESLQAKLAMQAELFKRIITCSNDEHHIALYYAEDALNATQADVDNWMTRKKAEWEKGVLGEVEQFAYMSEGASNVWRKVCSMIKERGEV